MKFKYGNGDQPLHGFTVKRGVGIGGFGEVYFATNHAGKEVALKQIQRNLDVEIRGVRQCLNLKHPNLIGLYDIQFDDDQQGWIVMEYVRGQSLRDTLDAHPQGLPRRELENWFSQIVAGVAYLHDHGIVHRDLKPANIFEDHGIVKIGDYGLSKFISCSRRGGQTESVGTFHYMAPEIGRGEYGKEIDVYALGIMLYEMATGCVPFDGESSQEIIMKHLTSDPDLSLVESPLREVIGRALAKNPASRTSDVRNMLRPLGWEVDERYLLVPCRDRSAAEPSATAEPPRVAASTFRAAAPQSSAAVSELHFREPIARNLYSGWRGLQSWWEGLAITAGTRTVLLVVAILLLVVNAEIWLPLTFLGLLLYVPYYAVWWTVRRPFSGRHRQAEATARHRQWAAHAPTQAAPASMAAPAVTAHPLRAVVSPPGPVKPQPVTHSPRSMSVKQWRVARRQQLAQVPRRQVWREVTGSWLGAAGVISVFSGLAALFQIGMGRELQPLLMGTVWAALVSLAMAWVAIGFGKHWQREEGDWALRAFWQLTSGFALGAFAFLLAEYLMIPWERISREPLGEVPVRRWQGFFDPDGHPLLAAYLAYFPLLMGLVSWWKQVDPLRRTRLSLGPVMWAIVAAALVHWLIPFPLPWGGLVAAGTALAIQLSSPWINPAERLQPSQVV